MQSPATPANTSGRRTRTGSNMHVVFFDRSTALAAWLTALLAGTTAVEVVTVGVSVTLVDTAVALA